MSKKTCLHIGLLVLWPSWSVFADSTTPLWARGYSVIPTPQAVHLSQGEVTIDPSWGLKLQGIGEQHIAARSFKQDLRAHHGVELQGRGPGTILLSVQPGAVNTGQPSEIDRQAYRLNLNAGRIEIAGNSDQGLFYGVQTLLQLVKQGPSGSLMAPRGTIEDWPRLELRILHWDTKHHQDRMETLKSYLDWSARFKVNMIGFELEDKFEYPSHPVIGAPGAFTTAELQELVNYGLERYIQIVPQIQAPAHMSYVLKHPEFADLRSNGSNFMSCLCDPRVYDLIFSMYDDVINATKGVDYVFASTDEVYYAGDCQKCECPYNQVNRSLAWVEFVQRAHDHLAKRGRKMLIWAEFPLLPEHVKMLPSGIIDGNIGNPAYVPFEIERGIRQLAYASIQGAELLFPDYLTLDASRKGSLDQAYQTVSSGNYWRGNPMGTYGAAWDDSGLHSETFWLGWSAVARWGWNPGNPSVNQHLAEFMQVYYGSGANGMVDVYRLLQRQARAWERTWDYIPSKTILTRYGSYFGKGIGTHRTDMTLAVPLINDIPDWFPTPFWSDKYKDWLSEAHTLARENDELIGKLQANLGKAERNQYNLEVFLVLADFIGHHWRLFLDLEQAESLIRRGQEAALADNPTVAVQLFQSAYDVVASLEADRESRFRGLQAVFEKGRYAKGRAVNGRSFVHVYDDVKDHFADRRPDLTYLTAPEESIGIGEWRKELARNIALFAKEQGVPFQAPKR